MNILDENIIGEQRGYLRSWRIPIRHIGFDIERKGIQDEEIIPLLHQIRRVTFFTCDIDFYKRSLCHARARYELQVIDSSQFVRDWCVHVLGRGLDASLKWYVSSVLDLKSSVRRHGPRMIVTQEFITGSRHHAPLSASSHYPSQPVEHFSQLVHSLRGIFGHQRKVWSDECPFVIAHIAGVCFAFHTPILSISVPKVHNRL